MNIDNLSLLSSPINLAKKYPIKPYKKNKEKEIKILVITKSKLKKKRFEYFAKTAKFIKKTKIIEKNKVLFSIFFISFGKCFFIILLEISGMNKATDNNNIIFSIGIENWFLNKIYTNPGKINGTAKDEVIIIPTTIGNFAPI